QGAAPIQAHFIRYAGDAIELLGVGDVVLEAAAEDVDLGRGDLAGDDAVGGRARVLTGRTLAVGAGRKEGVDLECGEGAVEDVDFIEGSVEGSGIARGGVAADEQRLATGQITGLVTGIERSDHSAVHVQADAAAAVAAADTGGHVVKGAIEQIGREYG